jgi:hypothetical protein
MGKFFWKKRGYFAGKKRENILRTLGEIFGEKRGNFLEKMRRILRKKMGNFAEKTGNFAEKNGKWRKFKQCKKVYQNSFKTQKTLTKIFPLKSSRYKNSKFLFNCTFKNSRIVLNFAPFSIGMFQYL